MQVTDHGAITDAWDAHRDVTSVRDLEHLLQLRDVGRHRVEPHGVDPHRAKHVGHPADVVEVGVGHDDHVELASPVRPKPAGSRVILAGIDQDASGWGLDQERIALAHVDGGDREVGRRQSAHHEGKSGGNQAGDRDGHREPRGPGPSGGEHPQTASQECHNGGRTCELGGTTHAGEGVRGPQHNPGGQPGDREQGRAEFQMDQGQHRSGEREHGRDRGCRHGHDVGQDGRHRDFTEGGEEQGNHGDLRADRDGDDVRQSSRHGR